MQLKIKKQEHSPRKTILTGYRENSFCDGDFKLSDKEKLMYRVYGKLFKKIKISKDNPDL